MLARSTHPAEWSLQGTRSRPVGGFDQVSRNLPSRYRLMNHERIITVRKPRTQLRDNASRNSVYARVSGVTSGAKCSAKKADAVEPTPPSLNVFLANWWTC